MKEDDARILLLVRAVESEDTSLTLLTQDDRKMATASALASADTGGSARRSDERFLAARSRFALTRLAARFPVIPEALRGTRWPGWANWVVPLAAFALGFATNEIDAGKRLNIIAFPLFGLIAWNIAVYALIVAHAVAGVFRSKNADDTSSTFVRLLDRVVGIAGRYQDPHLPIGRAVARFARDWTRSAGALTYARASRTFHLAAASLAVGIIAGMYVRALGLEYRAGWESTFISASSLHWLLTWLLSPASLLTGIAVPDASRLAALRWGSPANGENAARWIHLYAATASLLIVGPRLILATWSAIAAARLARYFRIPGREDFYVRRLLRDAQGGGTRVRVLPYGFALPDGSRRILERLLAATFGDDTRVTTDAAIVYGEEEEWLGRIELHSDDDHLVVLFNLASTPETENHGELVQGIRRELEAQRSGTGLSVLLDESAYRRRLAGQAGTDDRLRARHQAWERMLNTCGTVPVTVDLSTEHGPGDVRRLEAALLTNPQASGATP